MRLNSLNLKNISIHDPFWSKHVDLVRNAIIPYQWEAMNDRRILRLQQVERRGNFTGLFFRIQM